MEKGRTTNARFPSVRNHENQRESKRIRIDFMLAMIGSVRVRVIVRVSVIMRG